jgi:hypothetical protein
MLKNRIKLAILLTAVVVSTPLVAQKPYFQQDVAYQIHVRLDDQRHLLHATEELTYRNNSPDTLREIYMHLWPNAYLNQKTAYARQEVRNGSTSFHFAKDSTLGFIDSLDFRVGGNQLKWALQEQNPDIARIELDKPLLPGGSLVITTPFRVKLPASYSRMGHVGQQYQITQWYPKPAVYDRDGWQAMPYLDQGEFYSEFGSFDVYITIGKNYVVGATGDLPAGDPELTWLAAREAKSREMMLDKQLKVEEIFPDEFPEGATKTLHFHQEKVHDFAWFADKKYYVLTGEIETPQTKRKVKTVVMFNHRDRNTWTDGVDYVGKAAYNYSLWNGDYPYNHVTAVDGALSAGAGMEYPNITVVGAGGGKQQLEEVIMHEVGHNWYYGILASNERLHPWMDEGLNTFFENRYMLKYHADSSGLLPKNVAKLAGLPSDHTGTLRVAYSLSAMAGEDQPIELHSAEYVGINYGTIVYMKTGLAFRYLQAFLGDDVTDKCFHTYFDRWKFKHPAPADMQAVFEEVSGEDLDWFFQGFLSTVDQLDFRIANIDGNTITLRNQSATKAPAAVTLFDKEGKALRTVWSEPFVGTTTLSLDPPAEFHHARVNSDAAAPELAQGDNGMRAKGLFRRCKPLDIQFGWQYPDPSKKYLYWLPAVGANTEDGFMAGLLLYSGFLPRTGVSYHLLPMYGFRSRTLTGSAGFTLRKNFDGAIKEVSLRHRTSHYAGLLRSREEVRVELRSPHPATGWNHVGTFVVNHTGYTVGEIDLGTYAQPVWGELGWTMSRENGLTKSRIRATAGANFAEADGRLTAEAIWSRKLTKKTRLNLRGFGGALLSDGAVPYAIQLRPSGSGDPFGDAVLLDRNYNSGWLSQQLVNDQGGARALHASSYDRLLLAGNADFKLPVPGLFLFADAAYGKDAAGLQDPFTADAGLGLRLGGGVLEVRLPLVGTMYNSGLLSGSEVGQQVNFTFNPAQLLQSKNLSILGYD